MGSFDPTLLVGKTITAIEVRGRATMKYPDERGDVVDVIHFSDGTAVRLKGDARIDMDDVYLEEAYTYAKKGS